MRNYHKQTMSIGGWFKIIRCTIPVLGLELSGFLHFLFDYNLRVAPESDWFYCTIERIKSELGISRHTQERLILKLEKLGLIDIKVKGMPAKKHFKIISEVFDRLVENPENFLESAEELAIERRKGDSQFVENDNKFVENDNKFVENPVCSKPSKLVCSEPDKLVCSKPSKLYIETEKKDIKKKDRKYPTLTSPDVQDVVDHYRTYKKRSKPGEKERKKILGRLKEGYSVDDLKAAIDGNYKSPFHCGKNDEGKEYHSLELIMRDASHVDQFMGYLESESDKPEKPEYAPDGGATTNFKKGWVPDDSIFLEGRGMDQWGLTRRDYQYMYGTNLSGRRERNVRDLKEAGWTYFEEYGWKNFADSKKYENLEEYERLAAEPNIPGWD